MKTLKSLLKNKKFIAATVITAATVSLIMVQKKRPAIEVLVEDTSA